MKLTIAMFIFLEETYEKKSSSFGKKWQLQTSVRELCRYWQNTLVNVNFDSWYLSR